MHCGISAWIQAEFTHELPASGFGCSAAVVWFAHLVACRCHHWRAAAVMSATVDGFREAIVDFDEFVRVVESIRAARPNWFPDLLPPDAPATDQQLREAEAQLGVQLPAEYAAFVQRYGGGLFAFCEVYSLDPTSPVHLLMQNSKPWSRPDFMAVSDNGAGDDYGFAVRAGRCAGGPGSGPRDRHAGANRAHGLVGVSRG
jgi:hypothetical protein